MFWISLCMALAMFAIMVLLDKMIDDISTKKPNEITMEDVKLLLAGIMADISILAMLVIHAFYICEDWHSIFTGVGLLIMNLYFLHTARAKGKSTFVHAITMVMIALIICLPIVDILI